jgi:hypothetical protein
MRFVRLATIVFMQNDVDFVDLNQLYCVSTFTQVKNLRKTLRKNTHLWVQRYKALNMRGHSRNVGLRKIIRPQIQSNCNEKTSNQFCSYRLKPLPDMWKKIPILYSVHSWTRTTSKCLPFQYRVSGIHKMAASAPLPNNFRVSDVTWVPKRALLIHIRNIV